jgi:hypothetical protein
MAADLLVDDQATAAAGHDERIAQPHSGDKGPIAEPARLSTDEHSMGWSAADEPRDRMRSPWWRPDRSPCFGLAAPECPFRGGRDPATAA